MVGNLTKLNDYQLLEKFSVNTSQSHQKHLLLSEETANMWLVEDFLRLHEGNQDSWVGKYGDEYELTDWEGADGQVLVGGETRITLKIPNPRYRVYKNSNLVPPVNICNANLKIIKLYSHTQLPIY